MVSTMVWKVMAPRSGCVTDAGRSLGREIAHQLQVPDAQGAKDVEGLDGGHAGILRGPLLLVEGLDGVIVFSQGLAQAEGKHQFAVGKMTEDLGGTPLAGGGRHGGPGRTDGLEKSGEDSRRRRREPPETARPSRYFS